MMAVFFILIMKIIKYIPLWGTPALLLMLSACGVFGQPDLGEDAGAITQMTSNEGTATPLPGYAKTLDNNLPVNMSWQIQYSGEMDYSLDVDMFNIDLFDTDTQTIAELKERGIFVMCYFSAGSHEDWKPDARNFPADTLGKSMRGWKGETWLDIRQIEALKPVMNARLDMAAAKGCDGVDPDNVNGYENDTGFPLTYEDQIAFNIYLANSAHERGLLIGLKNDIFQIDDLQPYFDWLINEDCFSIGECDSLLPFVRLRKPVFIIDYGLIPWRFCRLANEMNFNLINKRRNLGAYRTACR